METFAALLGLQRFSTAPSALKEKISYDKCVEKPKGFFLKTSIDVDAEGKCLTVIQNSVNFLKGASSFARGLKIGIKGNGLAPSTKAQPALYPPPAQITTLKASANDILKQPVVKLAPTIPIDIVPAKKALKSWDKKPLPDKNAALSIKDIFQKDPVPEPVEVPDTTSVDIVVKQLQQLFCPTNDSEKKLCRDTLKAHRMTIERYPMETHPHDALAEIALLLAARGYRMVVRRTKAESTNYWGGASPGIFCYCVLPGTFTGHVVEPFLRDYFSVVNPTARYKTVMSNLPPVFVGPPALLVSVANLLCQELELCFKVKGAAQPPWRAQNATVCRWLSRCYKDLPVPILSLADLVHLSSEYSHASALQTSSSTSSSSSSSSMLPPQSAAFSSTVALTAKASAQFHKDCHRFLSEAVSAKKAATTAKAGNRASSPSPTPVSSSDPAGEGSDPRGSCRRPEKRGSHNAESTSRSNGEVEGGEAGEDNPKPVGCLVEGVHRSPSSSSSSPSSASPASPSSASSSYSPTLSPSSMKRQVGFELPTAAAAAVALAGAGSDSDPKGGKGPGISEGSGTDPNNAASGAGGARDRSRTALVPRSPLSQLRDQNEDGVKSLGENNCLPVASQRREVKTTTGSTANITNTNITNTTTAAAAAVDKALRSLAPTSSLSNADGGREFNPLYNPPAHPGADPGLPPPPPPSQVGRGKGGEGVASKAKVAKSKSLLTELLKPPDTPPPLFMGRPATTPQHHSGMGRGAIPGGHGHGHGISNVANHGGHGMVSQAATASMQQRGQVPSPLLLQQKQPSSHYQQQQQLQLKQQQQLQQQQPVYYHPTQAPNNHAPLIPIVTSQVQYHAPPLSPLPLPPPLPHHPVSQYQPSHLHPPVIHHPPNYHSPPTQQQQQQQHPGKSRLRQQQNVVARGATMANRL